MVTVEEMKESSIEGLIQHYVGLSRQIDKLQIERDQAKAVIDEKMVADNLKKYECEYGLARLSEHVRNSFMQSKAKEYLTEEQLKTCYEEKQIRSLTILSPEALAAQREAMAAKQGGVRSETTQ